MLDTDRAKSNIPSNYAQSKYFRTFHCSVCVQNVFKRMPNRDISLEWNNATARRQRAVQHFYNLYSFNIATATQTASTVASRTLYHNRVCALLPERLPLQQTRVHQIGLDLRQIVNDVEK